MPSADQVPVKSTHSKMPWPMWVFLIAGSAGAALSAVRSPNRYVTPDVRCNLVLSRRESGGFIITFVPCHHRPGHPGEFVGERDGGDLGGAPRQQIGEPGSMPRAMDLGIADHGERASREQAAQIAIALFADTAKLVLAPARVLLRHEPNPGGKIPSRSESLRISDAGDQSGGERGTNTGNVVEPLARLIGSVPGHDLAVKVENLHL